MALSVAIPLSGLEIDQFNNLAHHLLMNKIDFKFVHPDAKSSSSSSSSSFSVKSDTSYTSGISSLVSFSSYATPPSSTPISSLPNTPSKDKENLDCNIPTDTDTSVITNSTASKSRKSSLSTSQKSNLATDICELNHFYRQLLQIPVSQLYRQTGRNRRCLKSQKAANKLKLKPQLKIIYKERDILNLEANLREPSWQMRTPAVPKHNVQHFMSNRSIHYRLGDHGLIEDYPTRNCDECGFKVPSQFLF